MLSYKEYDNALAVEIVIKGFVSTQEVEDTAKKLEAFIARHGKVNVLEIIEDFEGMDATAFWQDFKFSLVHLNDFSRCAIVSDGKWVTPWSEIVAPFFKGEVRYFPRMRLRPRASGCCFLATRAKREVWGWKGSSRLSNPFCRKVTQHHLSFS
jgi:hypothetical protein